MWNGHVWCCRSFSLKKNREQRSWSRRCHRHKTQNARHPVGSSCEHLCVNAFWSSIMIMNRGTSTAPEPPHPRPGQIYPVSTTAQHRRDPFHISGPPLPRQSYCLRSLWLQLDATGAAGYRCHICSWCFHIPKSLIHRFYCFAFAHFFIFYISQPTICK